MHTALPPGVPDPASDAALADGIVTRDEIEALYLGYIDCLADAGVGGEVAWDLDLTSGLSSSLYLADGPLDEDGALLDERTARCDAQIDVAASAFASTYENPPDKVLIDRFAGCLVGLDPALDRVIDRNLGYDELYMTVLQSPEVMEIRQQRHVEVQRCADINLGPWREIPEA